MWMEEWMWPKKKAFEETFNEVFKLEKDPMGLLQQIGHSMKCHGC